MSVARPNVVFVFADQLRLQALGYAGDPNVQTPAIDRLAAESVNFTTAVSNCPICTPYRACLLTGQYPLTHGLFMNDLCLPDNGHSLGQEFAAAGYDTAWIGKWHLDGHGRGAPIPPERRQGFRYWRTLECTHDYNNSRYFRGDETEPRVWDGYDACAQTDEAVRYIREGLWKRDDDPRESFALFLSFGTPHDPYPSAPEDLKALYPPGSLALRDNVATHRREIARKQLQGYYAHVTAIDRCLAKIDEELGRAGLRDNTIFVFTSDHGDMLESQWTLAGQQRGARKQCPYDESIRVPLLIRYPAMFGSTGRTVSAPIAAPDIMPTLLSLCGLAIPETVEGLDFAPIISGDRDAGRLGALIANYHPFADWRTARGGRPYRGLRTERYTFVRDRNGPWLLFDNQLDPMQMNNLVSQASVADVQARLDAELARLLAERNDNFDAPEHLRRKWNYPIADDEAIPFTQKLGYQDM